MGCVPSKEAWDAPRQEPRGAMPDLEELRLRALHECRSLDTAVEARFNTITKLVQGIFKVPIVVVGLIEDDHLVLVSAAPGPVVWGSHCKRIHSFCDASLKLGKPTLMVVPDTLQDARFQHNEFVAGDPHVRFYGGAPLVSSEGYIYGSLGMMDLVPRDFPADMFNVLCNFAELVVRDLERDKMEALQKRRAAELAEQQQCLVRALSCFGEAIILCELSDPQEWRIQYANEAWANLTGLPLEASLTTPFWELLQLPEYKQKQEMARVQEAISQRQPFTLRLAARCLPGATLHLSFRPATHDHLGQHVPLVGIPSFVGATGGGDYTAVHYFATVERVEEGYQPESPRTPSTMMTLSPRTPTSPRSVLRLRTGLRSTSLGSASRYSGSTQDSTVHGRFGLDHPEALKDLKLGPLLGKGSYGRVYRGRWRGAVVAVKVLDTWVDSAPEGSPARRGPLLEALLSRELPHPHIVQTYEFATRNEEDPQAVSCQTEDGCELSLEDGEPVKTARQLQRVWIVQQYCNHGTLYDAIDRGWLKTKRELDGPINLLAVLQTAQDIASALSYLHAHDILHGDLTGNNVLLTSSSKDARRFTAQVGDFGLSRMLGSDAPVETASLGTVSHMPPEALVEGTVTKAVDVYSFGVLLWELYCQKRAWCGRRVAQIVYLVATLGSKLELPQSTPPAYKALAEACMHPDRTQRPGFDEILETLEGMIQDTRRAQAAAST